MLCLLPYFKRESMRKFVYLLETEKLASQYFIMVWQGIKITLEKIKNQNLRFACKIQSYFIIISQKYIFKQLLVFKFCCMISVRYTFCWGKSPRSVNFHEAHFLLFCFFLTFDRGSLILRDLNDQFNFRISFIFYSRF